MIDIENNTKKYGNKKCLLKVNKCLSYKDRKGGFYDNIDIGKSN